MLDCIFRTQWLRDGGPGGTCPLRLPFGLLLPCYFIFDCKAHASSAAAGFFGLMVLLRFFFFFLSFWTRVLFSEAPILTLALSVHYLAAFGLRLLPSMAQIFGPSLSAIVSIFCPQSLIKAAKGLTSPPTPSREPQRAGSFIELDRPEGLRCFSFLTFSFLSCFLFPRCVT